MMAENRGPYWRMLQINVRLQNVHNMAYIALQKGRKYQSILNSMITVRVEMELIKTGSFVHKIHEAKISLQVVNFAM